MKRPLIYILSIVCTLCACSTTKKGQQQETQTAVSIEFNADSAYAFCAAQCAFGPRTMNSEAHEQCAQWIQQQFQRYGYQVSLQKADLRGYDGTILHATNIIASQPANAPADAPAASPEGPSQPAPSPHVATESQPSAPAEPLPRILICAHWDSRPWADNDPDSANWRKPVMAANDGASGVAVMLELARLLQQHDSARVAVDFICFDAEDWGVPQWSEEADADSWALGAQYWASNVIAKPHSQSENSQREATLAKRELSTVIAKPHSQSENSQLSTPNYSYAILLDMVGGQGAKFYQEYYSKQYAKAIVDKVWQAASAAGYGSFFPTMDGGGVTDDHIPVNEKAHIPCIDIINYYPDCEQSSFGPTWHTVSDDMQHIDRNTLKAVGQTLVQLIYSE